MNNTFDQLLALAWRAYEALDHADIHVTMHHDENKQLAIRNFSARFQQSVALADTQAILTTARAHVLSHIDYLMKLKRMDVEVFND